MDPTPELSRPVIASAIPPRGTVVRIEANPTEREALAQRFQILGIQRLAAEIHLKPRRDGSVEARGSLDADVTQACVASLEPVDASPAASFTRIFRPIPDARPAKAEPEVELSFDPHEEDEELYEGPSFDLGETVAEELALALDPFPRHPTAVLEAPAEPAPEPKRENPFELWIRRGGDRGPKA